MSDLDAFLPASPPPQPSVLLVADEAELRRSLRAELERGGFAVAEARDVISALQAIDARAPDAALVAAQLPGTDGYRTCEVLRGLAAMDAAPVIVLTDPRDPLTVERAFHAGAADFLERPVEPERAVQRLRFALRAAAAFRALREETLAASRATELLAPQIDVAPLADASSFGLATLEELLEDLRGAQADARRNERVAAVLCVGLDRFQSVTASLSHEACERLVSAVARRLRLGIRNDDVLAATSAESSEVRIARVRGDEFCILLRDLHEPWEVSIVAQRLMERLAEPFSIEARELYLTPRMGAACYPQDDLAPNELVRAAEKAAYCARQEASEHVLFYSAGMHARAIERLALENGLRHAVERGELFLHYQPRVDVRSGRIVGVEALVRWNHPEIGRVSPLQFIPLAEETGLIVPIGEWILSQACEQNRRWQTAGLPPIRMAVNLSSVQFRQRNLCERVTSILRSSGLDAQWLELELTESLLMKDADAAIASLRRFRELGLHLSIDDFGTGYSSLSYLKRFPIGALKIDQSFIREVTTNADASAIVTAILLMGRSLKLKVVAEGVETRSQLSFLRVLQCDEVQGYLASPPVEPAQIEELLQGPIAPAFAA